ncbi:hypothetical protein CPC08DRAFT_689286 [Agrocybe pediades]|nr:hypothetical protein CPC08DRAFT_689286 [Agrocybe pediades]
MSGVVDVVASSGAPTPMEAAHDLHHTTAGSLIPYSLLSYNISLLNLSSIFNMLPASRFLARWKIGNLGSVLDTPHDMPTASLIVDANDWVTEAANTFASATTPMPATVPQAEMDQLAASVPGPWGFFTSWYMIGLLFMAILLHRMQNLVIPSRLPPPSRRARHAYRFPPTFASSFQYSLVWRRMRSALLPLDFSSTPTRLALHLPSMYLLCKMLLVWSVLVLQTCEIYPAFSEDQMKGWFGLGVLGWITSVGNWVAQKEMSTICWETFCAVCSAFLIEGFVKALDGIGNGFPIGNANPNTSPFNLVGYAFLLHVYSSPTAHSFKPEDDLPSRPDKHVIITIAIPLLQLTLLHILSVSKRLSTHRLFPTALTSFLSLLHFHGTLLSHYFDRSSPSIIGDAAAATTPSPTTILKSTSTSSSSSFSSSSAPSHVYFKNAATNYPLLNYIPNIFETILITLVLLTVSLNALAQLLVRGRVDRLFSGLGVGPGAGLHDDEGTPGFFESLPTEEDWGVLLLRVTVASLEATGLRGWGNEVAPINLPLRPRAHRLGRGGTREASARGAVEALEAEYGVVRMGRLGVGEVQYGVVPGSNVLVKRKVKAGGKRDRGQRQQGGSNAAAGVRRRRGFTNEVRTVDLGNTEVGNWSRSWWRRVKEIWKLVVVIGGVMRGLVMLLVERVKRRVWPRPTEYEYDYADLRDGGVVVKVEEEEEEVRGVGGQVMWVDEGEEEGEGQVERWEDVRRRREREMYERFLRGEEISDDEDEEQEEDEEEDEDEESPSDEDEETEQEEDREAEAVGLFRDLLRNNPQSPNFHSAEASGSSYSSGEMVLAHLAHNGFAPGVSSSPLTRRRWNAMFNNNNNGYGYEQDAYRGSPVPGRRTIYDEDSSQEQRGVSASCVICTVDARDIICWPCRCLAMCENCREALASKSTPSKHRCPCCRQTVEGYSRIYIP